jgi:hypothetical protein
MPLARFDGKPSSIEPSANHNFEESGMPTENSKDRELDLTKPTAARLYDYYLGGTAHYEVDKVFAERIFKINPYVGVMAQNNRAFLQRACRYLAGECGIRQFLDIGSGIPTVGNTHHVVREIAADARVVYVDRDLEAVNQSYDLLARENATNASIIEEDLRNCDSILDHPDTRRLLNFDEPVGILMLAVWPFVLEHEGPYELMARYRDRLASGSYAVMTHGSLDEVSGELKEIMTAVERSYDETRDPAINRTREQFTAFFDGFTLVDPGVVFAPDWRPVKPVDVDDPARPSLLAGVGRKP